MGKILDIVQKFCSWCGGPCETCQDCPLNDLDEDQSELSLITCALNMCAKCLEGANKPIMSCEDMECELAPIWDFLPK
jgi:hypothetical protein